MSKKKYRNQNRRNDNHKNAIFDKKLININTLLL